MKKSLWRLRLRLMAASQPVMCLCTGKYYMMSIAAALALISPGFTENEKPQIGGEMEEQNEK